MALGIFNKIPIYPIFYLPKGYYMGKRNIGFRDAPVSPIYTLYYANLRRWEGVFNVSMKAFFYSPVFENPQQR